MKRKTNIEGKITATDDLLIIKKNKQKHSVHARS